MAKKEESGLQVIVTLTVIALASAVLLAYVNKATYAPIEANRKAEMQDAIKVVLTGLENTSCPDTPSEMQIDNSIVRYFPAQNPAGRILGYAMIVKGPNGFSGDFDLMVGLDSTGAVIDTYVLIHQETPGLGDGMKKDSFKKQFFGKNLLNFKWKVKKDGGDVDALTAATITSRAFTNGVKRALLTYQAIKEGDKQ